MTKEQIFEKLKAILVDKTGIDEEQVTMQTRPVADLEFDSLDTVECMMDAERVFGIAIPDEDYYSCNDEMTVEECCAYIEKRLNN